MRKTILGLIVILTIAMLSSMVSAACTDSDGGLTYDVKGNVTGHNEDDPTNQITTVSDSCSGDILHEWICKNSEDFDDESYTCPNGCSNGACLSAPSTTIPTATCTDSDGGQNFAVKGTTSGLAGDGVYTTDTDMCDGNVLIEWFCSGAYRANTNYNCPNGCKEGACIKEKPACESTVDSEGCTVTKCPDGTVSRSCPSGKYVKLGEKFTLGNGESVKVTDYKYMKIIFRQIACTAASCGTASTCVGDNCPATSCVDGGYSSCYASLTVEMPAVCDKTVPGTSCASTGTEVNLREGDSKEVFGATLRFLSNQGGKGIFVVEKGNENEGYVDVSIEPKDATINYGGAARYIIKITDRHPIPTCPAGAVCQMPAPATYSISVQNLPFNKEYQKEVTIFAGRTEEIKLAVTPYQVTAETRVANIAGQAVSVPEVTKVAESPSASITAAEATSTEYISSEDVPRPVSIEKYMTYKFSVSAIQKNDPKNQDTDYAILRITPTTPPRPPEFPGEEVTIKLYKGWNLIRLPGTLIKFKSVEGYGSKLVGFVYYKGRFVTMNEAERLLGTQFREYLSKHAFWVYAPQNVALKVNVDTQVSFNGIELTSGWNLVPITEDMVGGYLKDIKGSCTFEKMYLWNPISQGWQKIDESYIFHESDMNYGIVIKTGEECILGGGEVVLTPPSMPE